ncbi:MAG: phage regulatory protein/antirepressor Ant [Alkaliphilus sp.]
MEELVKLVEGKAIVTSRMIAKNFKKEHKNILRAIDNLETNKEFTQLNFALSGYQDSSGKMNKEFQITRDGFSILVMGFTGKEAMQWKVKYVEAFNKMEEKLSLPKNYLSALKQLVASEEEKQILHLENNQQKQIIGELKPKADYVDSILKNKGLVTITQISKDYGMSGHAVNKLLHELGVQYKQNAQWLLYRKYHDKGYTHSITVDITRSDGRADIKMNTKWTQKGRLFLYELLKEQEILPAIETVEVPTQKGA